MLGGGDESWTGRQNARLYKILVAWRHSVVDPYHFDTDPDPGCEKKFYGSGSRANCDTDPDPGKNDTDPDPAKKRS